LERLGSLHLNDSINPLGSNRDRHADIGAGELGEAGCAAFLSEPRFDPLACVLETPGPDRQGPTKQEIEHCHTLRSRGSDPTHSSPNRLRKGGRKAAAR
jgi:deoxyribonuclease-4